MSIAIDIEQTPIWPLFGTAGDPDGDQSSLTDDIVTELPGRAFDVRSVGQGEFFFGGDAAANDDLTYLILGYAPILGKRGLDASRAEVTPGAYRRIQIDSGTATLGTKTGSGSTLVPSTLRLADTITRSSPPAYGAFMASHFGAGVAAHSPGNNLIATLGVAFGNLHWCSVHVWDTGQQAHVWGCLGT